MRWLKRLMEKVLRRMQGGGSLAAALKKWVPGEEAAMLLAGESGGRLQASLIELNGLLKNRLQVKSAIWKAVSCVRASAIRWAVRSIPKLAANTLI